ncbi:MAG: sporulation histidine kinase inhibitor Sda [Neobacillus sp.]
MQILHDNLLIETYLKALHLNLSSDFILLLQHEIKHRNLIMD